MKDQKRQQQLEIMYSLVMTTEMLLEKHKVVEHMQEAKELERAILDMQKDAIAEVISIEERDLIYSYTKKLSDIIKMNFIEQMNFRVVQTADSLYSQDFNTINSSDINFRMNLRDLYATIVLLNEDFVLEGGLA